MEKLMMSRFSDWEKKTKISLPKSGEDELRGVKLGGKVFGQRVYKHTKIFEADPTSKNSQRRAARQEKEARLGKEGKKDAKPASKGVKKGGAVKSELKSVDAIAKARQLKEQRRLKTGRHFKAKMKK
jgi:ATP-dependent RNA helicase DDX54/DBP10